MMMIISYAMFLIYSIIKFSNPNLTFCDNDNENRKSKNFIYRFCSKRRFQQTEMKHFILKLKIIETSKKLRLVRL